MSVGRPPARAAGAVLALGLALPAAAVAQPAPAAPVAALTLDAALDQAARTNQSVEAARRRLTAAGLAVAVARQRPNPEARVEFERETPTQAFSLGLPVEMGGKRGRRVALGEAGVAVSDTALAVAALDIRRLVRQAYFDVAAADARKALLEELLGLAGRATEAARQRFEAGSAPRLEVLQAELARADAVNQATAADGAAAAARARLNALLAQPPGTPLTLATPIDHLVAIPLPAADVTAAPGADLVLLDRLVAEQRARVALTSALGVPDLTPEATLTRGAEPEFSTGWRVALGVNVPLFTTRRPAVRVEESTLSALEAEREALAARVAGDVASARALADALSQQYRRYQADILPQALEVERLAEESYRLGRTGLAAYLQALQATRDLRLRMLQVGADFQTALGDLERALGRPLP
ncbi:MAG: TolC family protein [Vicinamibacterales bacterium]